METVYDVQQVLKKFGTYIYTGNRLGDLDLMDLEIDDLYHSGFLPVRDYQMTKLILRREAARLRKEKGADM